MKILFWLLVAVNVILFAVMKSGVFGGGQPEQVPLPLHQEKITLTEEMPPPPAPSSPVAAPASAPTAPAASPAPTSASADHCFEWGEFTGTDLEHVTTSLKKLQLGDKLSQREVDRGIGYWVYIPPIRDKAAIAQKITQLKARGVTDYFVVQEPGEWLNAISLGLFKSHESAQKFLEGLRAKEVRTAQIGERASKNKATVFAFSGLDTQLSDKLTAMQKNFPANELKSVSCH